jgi:hypothetical protein
MILLIKGIFLSTFAIMMESETLTLILVAVLILIVIIVFIRIAIRLRNKGGSLTTTMYASTYEFLDKDKREAIEHIVEVKANKKMKEEDSGELKQ